MRVVKVAWAAPGEPAVQLVDEDGQPVAEVNGFLRLLTVREYSPNTVRAYAHDLQKLFAFLAESWISAAEFTPARAMEFLQWLRLVLHQVGFAPVRRGRAKCSITRSATSPGVRSVLLMRR
jgi:site-specific recombinase XerD